MHGNTSGIAGADFSIYSARKDVDDRFAMFVNYHPLESQRILPEAVDEILGNIVSLITKGFVLAEGVAVGPSTLRQKAGNSLGGEFSFLDREKNPVGENRIDEPMGIAHTQEAFASVIHYPGMKNLAQRKLVRETSGPAGALTKPRSLFGTPATPFLLWRDRLV